MDKHTNPSPTAPQPKPSPLQAPCRPPTSPPDNELSSSFTQKLISILFLLLHLQFGFHSGVLRTSHTPPTPILLYFLQANGTIMEPWVWSEVCSLFPLTNTQNSHSKMNFSVVRLWSLTLVLHKKKKKLFKWEKNTACLEGSGARRMKNSFYQFELILQ